MNIELIVSIVAALIASGSAYLAWRSSNESRKSNEIGRLNALWLYRNKYEQLLAVEEDILRSATGTGPIIDSARKRHDTYSEKFKKIEKALEGNLEKLVSGEI